MFDYSVSDLCLMFAVVKQYKYTTVCKENPFDFWIHSEQNSSQVFNGVNLLEEFGPSKDPKKYALRLMGYYTMVAIRHRQYKANRESSEACHPVHTEIQWRLSEQAAEIGAFTFII